MRQVEEMSDYRSVSADWWGRLPVGSPAGVGLSNSGSGCTDCCVPALLGTAEGHFQAPIQPGRRDSIIYIMSS